METKNRTTLPTTGYVRLPQVLAVYPVSKSKLYDDIKRGKFPAPVKLSERISAWKVETLQDFLATAGRYNDERSR